MRKEKTYVDLIFALILVIAVIWMLWSTITPETWIGHGSFFGNDVFAISAVSVLWGWEVASIPLGSGR